MARVVGRGICPCRHRAQAGFAVACHGMVGRVRHDGRHDVLASRRRVARRGSVHRRSVSTPIDGPTSTNAITSAAGRRRCSSQTAAIRCRAARISIASQMMAALQQVADAYRDRADEISARSARLRAVRGAQRAARNADHDPRATIAHFRSLLLDRFDARQWRVWIGAKASTSPCAVVRAFDGRRRRQRARGRWQV